MGKNYIGLFHSVFPAAAEIIKSVLFQQTFDESINLFLVTLSYLYLSIYLYSHTSVADLGFEKGGFIYCARSAHRRRR